MKRDYKEHKSSGISIQTNFGQVIGIVFVFLVLFVLPIQMTNLYLTGELGQLPEKAKVLGTSTATSAANGSFLNELKTFFTADMYLYIGIALAVIGIGILVIFLINSNSDNPKQPDEIKPS
jgi:hypothetical protein